MAARVEKPETIEVAPSLDERLAKFDIVACELAHGIAAIAGNGFWRRSPHTLDSRGGQRCSGMRRRSRRRRRTPVSPNDWNAMGTTEVSGLTRPRMILPRGSPLRRRGSQTCNEFVLVRRNPTPAGATGVSVHPDDGRALRAGPARTRSSGREGSREGSPTGDQGCAETGEARPGDRRV